MWVSQIAGVTSVPGGQRRGRRRAARLGEAAAGERDDRAQAQRLGDRRPQVLVRRRPSSSSRRRCERRRVAQQQVEGPGERRRRRLVAGERAGSCSWSRSSSSLIGSPSSKRAATSIERMSVALFEVRVGAPLGDLGGEQLVDLGVASACSARERVLRRRSGARAGRGSAARGEAVSSSRSAEQRPQLARARGVVADAEDGAQDHLERHRLHPRVDRELARRPASCRSRASTISR